MGGFPLVVVRLNVCVRQGSGLVGSTSVCCGWFIRSNSCDGRDRKMIKVEAVSSVVPTLAYVLAPETLCEPAYFRKILLERELTRKQNGFQFG